jgi:prolyl-tRNA synthetase
MTGMKPNLSGLHPGVSPHDWSGGLIMTHSDDEGLVLPPRLAPIQVVIVPIPKPDEELLAKAEEISAELKARGIRVKIDKDDTKRPGFKFAEYEMKGVPIRLGLGRRDIENNQIEVARRDTKEKQVLPWIISECMFLIYWKIFKQFAGTSQKIPG